MSLEKAKRVRTRTIRLPGCVETVDGDLIDIEGREVVTILVSAGLWAPSQLGYAPFAAVVAEAAAEATVMWSPGCRGRGSGGRPMSPLMRRALWLHAVKGYSISGALRVLGHPSPETNGRRQLQRVIKTARAALHELRCSRSVAA